MMRQKKSALGLSLFSPRRRRGTKGLVLSTGRVHNVAPTLPRFPHLVYAKTRLQVALDGLAAKPHPEKPSLAARHSGRRSLSGTE